MPADKFDTISDVHRTFGLPMPSHPLITLINSLDNKLDMSKMPKQHVLRHYKISYKANMSGKFKYGQHSYDFDDGGLLFAAPNQVLGMDDEQADHSGYTLLIHPDFFLTYPIAKKIKQYGFFSYAANEALHLSDKEKATIIAVFKILEEELNSRLDDFSQDVIISQIELLLNYANRFYKRQFITRKAVNSDLLDKMNQLLDAYFEDEQALRKGVPTVQFLSEQLNLSPGYLSDMLRSLSGQNAQQHIHNKVIEIAKEKLATTRLSVGEVAYALGFEYPQSFSKLFKTKTNYSPLEYRKSFN